ncbi:MAG TPA: MBOAT family protein [Cyanobacteria bacterium UBA11369]|nr:MBOAT family protein [Cyanobacteria bacterium UBA11371]HBE32527.1 MBOAT family protein [Cyanobacteria bacterium UBA11368]HBE47963.1 MBOAT family protein [Cyanobacteria bacterium UBA11369]
MTFNSVEFVIFFTVTYLLYRVSARGQNLILLAASYIFYACWDVRFVFLLVLSTAVDFYCGWMIETGRLSRSGRSVAAWFLILAAFLCVTVQWNAVRIGTEPFAVTVQWNQLLPAAPSGWLVLIGTVILVAIANLLYPIFTANKEKQRRDLFLWISICTNLGLLGFFKYFNFFIDSAEAVIRALGIQSELLHLNIVLPIAISFYTFKTISYTVDIYRGKIQPAQRFSDFALFLAYFPALLAGPIDRASGLLPQLSNPRQLSFEQSAQGIFLILFGLFKKVAISDGVAVSVNAIYGTSGTVSWIDVVLATFLYTIQIYGDFSGYTDMARGISKLFGIELMLNFNLPYFSKDPSEFWRRWHISLSTWLRDYLYIPLGGNRQGELRTYLNLMTTMVLGGLWHGAAWNFVLWGFYQGALLCVYRAFSSKEKKQSGSQNNLVNWQAIVATLFFFVLTCYGWLLFRATSLAQIITFTKILFVDIGNFALTMPKPPLPALLGIPVLIGYEFFAYKSQNQDFFLRYPTPARAAIYATLLIIVFMGLSNAPAQYIYSQF